MNWIFYGIVYAIFNAMYLSFNQGKQYNGYLLGIIRGLGICVITSPLLLFVSSKIDLFYFVVLIIQGILIGIYDSHIFFSSSRYGANSTFGFMATSVFITLVLWWIIEFQDFIRALDNKISFLTLIFILMGISSSYWQTMKVKINMEAEKYLYPAVFSLSFMSIATRYIALKGGSEFDGIIYYLTISCGVSGIYNLILFYQNKAKFNHLLPHFRAIVWLIFFSLILISAKTLAFREAKNPSYVMSVLLISPIILEVFNKKKVELNINKVLFFCFVFLLFIFSYFRD